MATFASVFVGICLFFSVFPLQAQRSTYARGVPGLPAEAQDDHHMTQQQCKVAFPLLYPQLAENAAAWKRKGGIKYKHIQDAAGHCRHGCVHIVIQDGQIFIRAQAKDWQSRVRSVLQLLRLAYEGAPTSLEREQLHNTELVISTADFDGFMDNNAGDGAGWVLDRRVTDQPGQYLYPDFSFASWPEAGIPSFQEFRRQASAINAVTPWEKKQSKALWRGDALQGSNIAARNSLLKVAAGPGTENWSDVKRTSFWETGPDIGSIVAPADHCTHKYLVHSEGVAYSGRSKFILSCQSAVIMHKLEWKQHFHDALIHDSLSADRNVIQLSTGAYFESLPSQMQTLLLDDQQQPQSSTGLRVAQNAKRTLTDRYLTPAATSCYIRAALISYNSVLDRTSWPTRDGPQLRMGSGVKPGAGTSKGTLKQLGVEGDIELGVWHNLGQPEWPPS